MAALYTNNASTTLASGITNSATSLTVTSGNGTKFPSPTGIDYFMCTLQGASGTPIEIVKVTARSTDTFTIVRAQEGTTASAFNANDIVELRVTAAEMTQINQLGQGNASTMKNRIINGAMVIDQRNAGASVTATGIAAAGYTVDRWAYFVSAASKFTVQQNAGAVTLPTGFTNYLGATSSSAYSVLAADYFGLQQAIEGFNIADLGWGTANAKSITISFWAYSSLTGTFSGSLRNPTAYNRSYIFSYSIPVANTWTQISVTITGDTTGTWVTNNSTGIVLFFSLGAGSTYSGTAGSWTSGNLISATGATSVVGTSGATFYITGVQLEVGSSATGFEYRQYGTELALCQRYFEKTYAITTKPGTVTSSLTTIGSFPGAYSTWFNFTFQANKRAEPTMTSYSPSSGATGNMSVNMSSDVAIAAFIAGGVNQACAYAAYTGNASLYVHMTASSEL